MTMSPAIAFRKHFTGFKVKPGTCTNNKMSPQTGPQALDIILQLFLEELHENPQNGDLNTLLLCGFGYVQYISYLFQRFY